MIETDAARRHAEVRPVSLRKEMHQRKSVRIGQNARVMAHL